MTSGAVRNAERRIAVLGDATLLDLYGLELTDSDLETLRRAIGSLTALTTLDLSGNLLTVAPEVIGSLTALTALDLGGNLLEVVPEVIGSLTALSTLDLSSNRLELVPEAIGNLSALTTLDLSSNRLEVVPEVIGSLTGLTTLDLSSNRLEVVPEVIGSLTALTTLDLSSNRLEVVPEVIGSLTALTSLDLSFNRLELVPEVIGSLTALTTLNLRANQLHVVPEVFGSLTALTTLNLGGNPLGWVPEGIGSLTALTTLDLSSHHLTVVPELIGSLTALTTLNLGDNLLHLVPDGIGSLTALTTLDLSGNSLDVVPEVIGSLTALTTLDLSGNRLEVVPEAIGNLTALTTLDLSNNQLTLLREVIGSLTALTTLNLGGNLLHLVPDGIGSLTALTTLDLSFNLLTVLPEVIGSLTVLTTLNLSNNQLTVLPEVIGSLTALTTLDLGGNRLTVVPEVIGSLTALTTLDLGGNRLTVLPEVIGSLTALTTLDLGGNRLTVLPEGIGSLTVLTTLDLGGNRLTVLPEGIGSLTVLTTLILGGNQLTVLPKGLGSLLALTEISISGNSLPPEVEAADEESTEELLQFLRMVDDEGVELAEAKLILVGEGAVGKSSLLAALCGEPWVSVRDQTHGLQVKQFPVEHIGGAITLNGWDFGGQQVYRPTHQLFFTAPAVYLVVWKPREGPENGMVEQWLAMIQHRTGADARVHVVATHGGPSSRVSAIDESRLRERFGELIAGFHDVDSKFPNTLAELKAAIVTTAAGLRHTRRWYPASWLRVREEFGRSDKQSLSYEDYLKATQRNGLTEIGARSLAINSHTLGYWIYYADEPALAQVVILKPDWLSVAIVAVLEDPEAAASGGVVPHRTFGRIWSTSTPRSGVRYSHSQQQMFLRLMERFELTYRVPELEAGEPISLVGQLVPSARPSLTDAWDIFRPGEPEGVEICQVVERGTDRLVAPEGLIYRLIVRLHRQALDRAQAPEGAYWRGGLVVQNRYEARALITLTADGVRVQVRGPDQSGYVHQISDEIRDCVEGFWSGLMTIAKVPCRETCGLGTPGRGLFDVDKLMDARYKHGQKQFPCMASGCGEYPLIDALLGSVRTGNVDQDRLEVIQTRLEEVAAGQVAGTHHMLARIENLHDDVKAIFAASEAKLNEILSLQNDEAKDGPRLFSLAPMRGTVLHPGWTTRRMQLTLYCEYSRWPVHALDPDHPQSGIYTIDVPKDWWVKALPLLKITSTLIKPFLGISLAAIELDYSESQWKAVKEQLALGKETLNAAADAAGAIDATSDWQGVDPDRGGGARVTRAEAGVLRSLHQMLREQDISFAGLHRVTQQGRYLWVHPSFVPIFQLPPPVIPT